MDNSSQKIHFNETRARVAETNKAGRPIRQAGQQGRWADKADGLTRQAGQQGRWPDKADGLSQQMSLL